MRQAHSWRRPFLLVLLLALLLVTLTFLYSLATGTLPAGKLLGTMSAIAALASLTQLAVSGLWEKVLNTYGDVEKFPFGPPSHVTRGIMDSPDAPVWTWLRNVLFLDPRLGAHLGVASVIAGGAAVWL